MTTTHRVAARIGALGPVGLAVLFAATVAVDTTLSARRDVGSGAWTFELAAATVVCLIAVLRGRDPVAMATGGLCVGGVLAIVAVATSLPSQPGPAATLGLLVLGAAATRVAPGRASVLVALGGVVVMVVGRVSLRGQDVVPAAIAGNLVWGAALACGVWLRLVDHRRHTAIETARRDERLDLARELHDVVAHHVAGIVVQAQAAQLGLSERPSAVAGMLADIETAGADALTAMRTVVGLLRDPGDVRPLAPDTEHLTTLIERFDARHGAHVDVHLTDHPEDVGRASARYNGRPEVASTVYRIVQEALTNIVLHAPLAQRVTITMTEGLEGVVVEVTDDGPARAAPANPLGTSGHGLVGMRERVHALGGTLHAQAGPDGGWAVRAVLPYATAGRR